MKRNHLVLSLLLTSSLYATDTQSVEEKSVVDKAHKSTVETLNEGVDTLPESIQDTAKDLVKDIDKDGKNLGFILKLTNVAYETNFLNDGSVMIGADPAATNYILATAGVRLLPNTWKIDISYTGQVSEDAIYESKSRSAKNITSYSYDEGKTDFQYISFYTKPINKEYGSIGFGYKSVEQTEVMMTDSYGMNKIVDLSSLTTGNARYKTKYEALYLTYSIPSKDRWYSGFGFSVMMGNTNQSVVAKPKPTTINGDIVIKPDTDFEQIDIGINKTLNEVNDGLSFKTLTIGYRTSSINYYDYFYNEQVSEERDYDKLDFELIYMYKLQKEKKFYTSFKMQLNEGGYEEYEEFKFELGLLF
jgi:hypothetical protein